MTDLLALGLMLLALPGLLLARSGPVAVRLLTFAALTVLLMAALDLEQVVRSTEPARVAVVGTDLDGPAEEVRQRLSRAGVDVEGSRLAGPQRLALGALVAGPRAEELALVWSGPTSPQALPLAGHGVTALVPGTALDLDPEQLQVWPVGPFEAGRPATLQVRLAESDRSLDAQLTVTDPDGRQVLAESVALGPQTPVVDVALVPARPGVHEVRFTTDLEGVVLERRGRFSVFPPHPVLLVGSAAEQLAGALEVQGMEVAARSRLPEALDPWSAVVLLDPVPADQQQRLAAYLDAGGGVFVVGGEGGALPGRTEPLHELLPVSRLDREGTPQGPEGEQAAAEEERPREETQEQTQEDPPPEPERPRGEVVDPELDPVEEQVDRRLVGMVLVVDRSMSMGTQVPGGNLIRMDYAKRAALETARALQEGDQLGIVTFGNQGYHDTVLPMTPVTDWGTIEAGVSRLSHHRESTYLASGLEAAGELLENSALAVRFVVVVTDGIFQDELLAPSVARQLAAKGVSVSLIQIAVTGEGGAARSRYLTEAGQGRYVLTANAREVPRLVVAEVGLALGRVGRQLPEQAGLEDLVPDPPPIPTAAQTPPPVEDPPVEEQPDAEAETRLRVRAVADSVLLEPRRPEGFPDLGGMDAVTGRPDAHVLLVGGEEGLPLLAFANRGLGRIAVWASDLTGAWGAAWREDPDFPGRLATWVQSLFPPREELPRDLLQESELKPPVPTPAELAALQRIAGGPVLTVEDYRAPEPRSLLSTQGLARELAIAGALSLVLLALGEFLLLRWKGGSAT